MANKDIEKNKVTIGGSMRIDKIKKAICKLIGCSKKVVSYNRDGIPKYECRRCKR